MQGTAGLDYKLSAGAGGYSYDLTMTASAPPLIHDTDGLVDFAAAGVTYYYSRPRLDVVGTLRGPNGRALRVTGLAWLDKQWGDFQPSAVEWNWASIQLDDGTDVMVTTLYDDKGALVDTYATFRRLGGEVKRLDGVDFTFTSLDAPWHSQRSDTTYHTEWRVKIPSEGIDLVLQPSMVQSEFSSQVLGVAYWESAVSVVDRHGRAVGQGFVELNRMLGSVP
jgi:predicted secreted hydrolase